MTKHAHSMAGRHPDRRKEILGIAENNAAFEDLCGRFGKLWDSLNELENEPGDTERLHHELKHLELEVLNMLSGHGRV